MKHEQATLSVGRDCRIACDALRSNSGPTVKHACINCHFLAKDLRDGAGSAYSFSWTKKDRDGRSIDDQYAPRCHFGVWDAGIDPSVRQRLDSVLSLDRGRECFFIETHEGMSFPAARELQRRREENSQLKRTNRYAVIGLWIAAAALTASLLLEVYKLCKAES